MPLLEETHNDRAVSGPGSRRTHQRYHRLVETAVSKVWAVGQARGQEDGAKSQPNTVKVSRPTCTCPVCADLY